MFTGLVEECGRVLALDPNGDGIWLRIAAETVLDDVTMGASIAVNGVCLTVVDFDVTSFAVDAVPETMDRSSLGGLSPGMTVNLERSVRAHDRLGGHIVQGHVDATTTITRIEALADGSFEYRFRLGPDMAPYVVEKAAKPFPAVGNATMWNTAIGWRMTNSALPKHWTISNGESAEKIAREWGITREAQDAFAVRSHQRAASAWAAGVFDGEIVAVPGVALTRDEGSRDDTSVEKLAGRAQDALHKE